MLIHDDVDNCGQDVCAAVGEIAKTSPGLVVHTIGIGLDQAEAAADELRRAADGRQAARMRRTPPASPRRSAKPSSSPTSSPTPRRRPRRTAQQARQPQTSPPRARRPASICPPGLGAEQRHAREPGALAHHQGRADGELIREATAPTLVEKLPPGTYEVEARLGPRHARTRPSRWRPTRRRRCASISTPAS